jgi:hypothetical protein
MIAMPDPYGYKVCSHEEAEPFHRARHEPDIQYEQSSGVYTLEDYFKGLNKVTMADDKEDMVNSPSHYTQGSIECIDAIAQVVKDLQGMEAMCTGNAIKYLWRWKHKNGVEDLKKAQWYLQRMIDNSSK